VQNLHQFLTFQKKTKKRILFKLETSKNLVKAARMRDIILRAMSVEYHIQGGHENDKESHHYPPSSFNANNIKANSVEIIHIVADQSLPPHQCKVVFVTSALKMTKLIKIRVQKSPKFHKLTN